MVALFNLSSSSFMPLKWLIFASHIKENSTQNAFFEASEEGSCRNGNWQKSICVSKPMWPHIGKRPIMPADAENVEQRKCCLLLAVQICQNNFHVNLAISHTIRDAYNHSAPLFTLEELWHYARDSGQCWVTPYFLISKLTTT